MNRDRRRGRYISPHGSKTWEYFAIFACTLLILSLGIVLGWNSPMVLLLSSPDSPIHDNKLNIATLTAFLSAGQMLAPVINVLVIDKIGRKYTILLCGFPLVASWSIILMTRSAYAILTQSVQHVTLLT
ncbi:hypothetical protein M0804_014760 [Polistes exclamans]|nr:hypothetical protein M0804_014760 [Polistes exclamans]